MKSTKTTTLLHSKYIVETKINYHEWYKLANNESTIEQWQIVSEQKEGMNDTNEK